MPEAPLSARQKVWILLSETIVQKTLVHCPKMTELTEDHNAVYVGHVHISSKLPLRLPYPLLAWINLGKILWEGSSHH